MRLEQLKQVVVLEEVLSISKAAKELYMTQPALSMSLTSLENELGIKLFERRASGVVPTADEQAISCFVHGILQDVERLEELHEKYIGQEQNASVAVMPELYDEVLMEVLKLRRAKPSIKVMVFSTPAQQLLGSLYTGQCDLAVLSCADSQRERFERQLKTKRISFELLGQSMIHLCVRKDHPLAGREEISQEDMLKERVIFQKECTYILQTYGLLEKVVHPNWLAVDDAEILKKLVMSGYGVGLIQHICLEQDPYFNDGPLLLRPLEELEKSQKYLLYDKQHYSVAFKQELLESLRHSG